MGRRIMIMLAVVAAVVGASPAVASGQLSGYGVGDTVRLAGASDGQVVAATVTKVVDPARGADEFNQPATGNRFVATQFRIANVGTVAFDDAPQLSVTVIDRRGQVYNASFDSVSAGPSMPGDLHVTPGQSRLGYVVFEIPTGTRLAQVEYSPAFGLGDTADWNLPAPATARPKPPPPPAPLSPATPADVVRAYYDAINDGDYATAWSLGGDNLGGSYDDFVAGFAGTAHDDLTIEGASGDVVHIELDAAQTDGSHKLYAGTYTVHDGVIVDANIHRR